MELKVLAEQAITVFGDIKHDFGFQNSGQAAAIGYFRGVAAGTITCGQSWLANIFINSQGRYTDEQRELVSQIFASGMCCDGQDLDVGRKKSLAERVHS